MATGERADKGLSTTKNGSERVFGPSKATHDRLEHILRAIAAFSNAKRSSKRPVRRQVKRTGA